MGILGYLFQILLSIFVAVYAICICIVWFGMFSRIFYLAIREFWRRGFAAFRVSYEGNRFDDVG